ncbi:hypothetical protein [Nesterenkonia pannonica]|uniref:hypothetical protein n=1 Tax=Nesterenkonia pannonica TaxID=1548602 RepID=UPI002164CE4B|nr:hypothetical protein [Nesterenkonia pannonica]
MSTPGEDRLALPLGASVRLNAHTYVFDAGRILMGGSPPEWRGSPPGGTGVLACRFGP